MLFRSKSIATLAPKKVRFSYSTADQPVLQRAVIQAIEKIGGQRKLKKLYFQHQKNLKNGENFFDSALRLLRMKLEFDEAALARRILDRLEYHIRRAPEQWTVFQPVWDESRESSAATRPETR